MGGLMPHEKEALRTLLRSIGTEIEQPIIYGAEEIIPIPAICTGPKRHEWIEGNGNGAIRAPTLRHCCCFWCGEPLKPHPDYPGFEDAETRRKRREGIIPTQLALEEM